MVTISDPEGVLPEVEPVRDRLWWPKTIEAPDEFMKEITSVTSTWAKAWRETRPWFRGLPQASFTLEPSLLRYRSRDLTATEQNLRGQFHAHGVRLLDLRPKGDLELFTIMQHHGVPTRLLDWTENALAGLYFSVRDPEYLDSKEDAVVWVFDPLRLAEIQTRKRWIPYSDDRLLAGGLPLPLPLYPLHNSHRVTAQRGTFTVHPFLPQHSLVKLALAELDAGRPSFLFAFRIARNRCRYVRDGLVRAFGLGDFTIFPDLDGLARELRMLEGLEGEG